MAEGREIFWDLNFLPLCKSNKKTLHVDPSPLSRVATELDGISRVLSMLLEAEFEAQRGQPSRDTLGLCSDKTISRIPNEVPPCCQMFLTRGDFISQLS